MMINHVIQISYFLTFLYICSISYTKCIFKISSYECIPIFTNYINFYIQRQCYQINTHLGLLCCLDELTYLLWYFPISCNISSFMSILNNITTNAGISVYFWWVFANNTSVQSLSRVRLFATPWITARQASLSITNSRSFTQTRVHRVSGAIQPSHPRSSPSPPAPNPSQHQSLFQWVNSSHEVAKVLEFQL